MSRSKALRFAQMSLLSLAIGLGLVVSAQPSAEAADPAFVGVLSVAVEPDIANELGLSDELRGQLLALIDKREQEVQPLALNKDLPADERAAKLAEFVA